MNNELYLILIFIMAMLLGYELIKKIPPTLHTPLMSGTNAISGIVIIGSILVITSSSNLTVNILGFISLVLSSINVFGGFIVTDRMLEMFKKPKKRAINNGLLIRNFIFYSICIFYIRNKNVE